MFLVAILSAVALHFDHSHSLHTELGDGELQVAELEWPYDRAYLQQRSLPHQAQCQITQYPVHHETDPSTTIASNDLSSARYA
jgi:hypothetical protein